MYDGGRLYGGGNDLARESGVCVVQQMCMLVRRWQGDRVLGSSVDGNGQADPGRREGTLPDLPFVERKIGKHEAGFACCL